MIPFSGSLPSMVMLEIIGGERPSRPAHPALTNQLWVLVQKCWDQDPQLRPEITEVLQVLPVLSVSHSFWQLSICCLDWPLMCSDPPAWKQLISYPLPAQECISLITSIFSDYNESKLVGYLSGDDAQIFSDVVDKVNLDILSPQDNRLIGSCWKFCMVLTRC